MSKVTVRFFATLRDRAGTDFAEIELPEASASVEHVLTSLASRFPGLGPILEHALLAVNHEYVQSNGEINDGDELAIFPPVSGGANIDRPAPYVAVTYDPLDIEAIIRSISTPETGGVCIFTGSVRGHTVTSAGDRKTDHLEYEAYEPMALRTLQQVVQEIWARYESVQGVAAVQRIGKLKVGDMTVLVACSGRHRHDGIFEAARYGIERLKQIVPVWKKEIGSQGELWIEGTYRPTPADNIVISPVRSLPERLAYQCKNCERIYTLETTEQRCECGGYYVLANTLPFRYPLVDKGIAGMWRYKKLLLPDEIVPVSMGEGMTPLLQIDIAGRNVSFKLEGLNPTGSFKDRGASVLVSLAKASGARLVHDDSSGNAGAALAAYAAFAGLKASLFVPAHASEVKLAQIALYGASLIPIAGTREDAAAAAGHAALNHQSYYASHVFNPLTIHANKTIAYEIWEQLGFRAPDIVVVPAGHGTQLLGLAYGFRDLLEAGLVDRTPRLIGVQASECAPLFVKFSGQGQELNEGCNATIAEGIRIAMPVRSSEILDEVVFSGGQIVTVTEDEIRQGLISLAQMGILAEPTSAVVWAGYQRIISDIERNQSIILSISGNGLKTPHIQAYVPSLTHHP